MTRKDIQFIIVCVGATALVVIAAHLIWPPKTPTEGIPIYLLFLLVLWLMLFWLVH